MLAWVFFIYIKFENYIMIILKGHKPAKKISVGSEGGPRRRNFVSLRGK